MAYQRVGAGLLSVATVIALAAPAAGQPARSGGAEDQGRGVDLFGFAVPDDERLKISALIVAAWSHDGAQAQLGFEKQGRVGQATVTFSGRVTDRVRYLVSFNPVNEVAARPACGEADFFFPNDARIYNAGPIVPCDVEHGHKRVDTYNTLALDYVNQQGPLREGYVDWRATGALSFRFGRFILPMGFAPREVGSWTAKDLTRIQRLNAEANFGLMLAYTHRAADGRSVFDAAAMGVLGDGNRQHDYDWFYFADTTLDSNSAMTFVGTVRARPHAMLDIGASYKRGFTGSKVERLPSYWASKRIDDAFVASARVSPRSWVSVFGEYARYVWGPTVTSAAMLGLDTDAIEKPGYYFGATFEAPVTARARAGVTVTREELSRDDSLIKYLAAQGLYGVAMGKKDRSTIARVYLDVARLVTVGVFWADVSNPFPWVSGSWPVSGPRAFTGRAPDRYGITVTARTP